MALFCLRLPQFLPQELGEIFLDLTPFLKVQNFLRPQPYTMICGDLKTTFHLHKSLHTVANKVESKCQALSVNEYSLVFTKTCSWGRALSFYYPFLEDGGDKHLSPLPLDSLRHLIATEFSSEDQLHRFIEELEFLGFKNLEDLQKLTLDHWIKKYQKTGRSIYQILQGLEQDLIPVWKEKSRLQAQRYFEPPIESKKTLLHLILSELERLFLRLEGRNEKVDHLRLQFDLCYHPTEDEGPLILSLKLSTAQLDLKLYEKTLEEKLSQINFNSPIQEFHLEVIPLYLPAKQENFFDAQKNFGLEKIQNFQALLETRKIESGFLAYEEAFLPEKSFCLKKEPELFKPQKNEFEIIPGDSLSEESWKYKSFHSKLLFFAPRPTRMLPNPQILDIFELQQCRRIPYLPKERIECQSAQPEKSSEHREYWVAKNSAGQMLWIFKDLKTQHFYLHGYFD